MRCKAVLIIALLVIFLAAPLVDAVACDECRDIAPVRQGQQLSTRAGQPDADRSLSAAGIPASQGTDEAKDLCPVCANTAAAIAVASCSAPFLISQTSSNPWLLALADPSYPITKPPQN
jgi:hypothetical protein